MEAINFTAVINELFDVIKYCFVLFIQLLMGGLCVYTLTSMDTKQKETIKTANYAKQLLYALSPIKITFIYLHSHRELAQEYLHNRKNYNKGLQESLISKCEEHEIIALSQLDVAIKGHDIKLWQSLEHQFSSLPIENYELLFRFFTQSRTASNNLLNSYLNFNNPQIQACIELHLKYIEVVELYLKVLSEEGQKKYYQYFPLLSKIPLLKWCKFHNIYTDQYIQFLNKLQKATNAK